MMASTLGCCLVSSLIHDSTDTLDTWGPIRQTKNGPLEFQTAARQRYRKPNGTVEQICLKARQIHRVSYRLWASVLQLELLKDSARSRSRDKKRKYGAIKVTAIWRLISFVWLAASPFFRSDDYFFCSLPTPQFSKDSIDTWVFSCTCLYVSLWYW